MCMCTVLLLTMVQVLYLLEMFILAHYGAPSTETPTTETTAVQCHKNSWIYLTRTYYWWLLRPTITIWFEMKKHYLHSTNNIIKTYYQVLCNNTSYNNVVQTRWTQSQVMHITTSEVGRDKADAQTSGGAVPMTMWKVWPARCHKGRKSSRIRVQQATLSYP